MECDMKPHADRPYPLHGGFFRVALCAAALLVLAGGCGQFNDDPNPAGMGVRYQFNGGGANPASVDGSSTPQAIIGPVGGTPVFTVVVGAIVVTPLGTGPGGAYTQTDALNLTDAQREQLEQDAIQSAVYMELVQLPSAEDSVEFRIPPSGAGNWQLIGVGLRNPRLALEEIQNIDPIWYGFIGEFLNGKVVPGQVYPTPLALDPWCGPQNPNPPLPPHCP
jgi:hypothetical protein